jgi:competence protein ComEC
MERFAFAWSLTLCLSLFWPALPTLSWLGFSLFFGLFSLLRHYLLLAGGCLAICWFGWQANTYQQQLQSLDVEAHNHTIQANVLAVVNASDITRITLKLTRLDDRSMKGLLPFVIRLNWYNSEQLIKPGDELQAEVILKPAWGSANQGGFGYGRWLMSQGISGIGYIKQGQVTPFPSARSLWLNTLRELTQPIPQGGIIYALLVGDKRDVPSLQLDRWQRAGVGHLLAISGLHLGLVAACGWLLGRLLLLIIPFGKSLPLVLALTLAMLYGYSASWPISAQRAMVMLTLGLGSWHFARIWRPWQSWLLALWVVLLIWPLAIYSVSFWLSFGAMGWLLLLNWFFGARRYRFIALQLGLTLGLIPIQLGFFSALPLFSAPINLIMIPLFAWIIVPLLLFGVVCVMFSQELSQTIFAVAGRLIGYCDAGLDALDHCVPLSVPISSHSWPSIGLAVFAILLVWVNRSRWTLRSGLLAGVIFALAVLFLRQPSNWRVHFIDVDQGLAVVVERHGHGLVYDTGARYRSGFEFAKAAIIPLLAYLGIHRVDWLVMSHGDNDHAGGLETLRANYPEAEVRSGADRRVSGGICQGEERWQGLTIRFIQADIAVTKTGVRRVSSNDGSCVVLIDDGQFRVLLTGDIEAKAEARLMAQGSVMPVTVLSAPHHGSDTSSSPGWVRTLKPAVVVVSAGAFNRYGFPSETVVGRYAAEGADIWVTGQSGQVSVTLGEALKVETFRRDLAPFWYNRLLFH